MSLIALSVLIALIIGLLWAVHWLKSHCPACRKPWTETGRVQGGEQMAGRNAYLKEWHCRDCGYSAWIKSF